MTSNSKNNKDGANVILGLFHNLLLTVNVGITLATVIVCRVLSKLLTLVMIMLKARLGSSVVRVSDSRVSLHTEIYGRDDTFVDKNCHHLLPSVDLVITWDCLIAGDSTYTLHSTPEHRQTALTGFAGITPLERCRDYSSRTVRERSDSETACDDDQSATSDPNSSFDVDRMFRDLSSSDRSWDGDRLEREVGEICSEIWQITELVHGLSRPKDDSLVPSLATYDGRDDLSSTDSSYLWDDYETDFLSNNDVTSFVAFHPVEGIGNENTCSATINYNCSTFDHVRPYIESCLTNTGNEQVSSH